MGERRLHQMTESEVVGWMEAALSLQLVQDIMLIYEFIDPDHRYYTWQQRESHIGSNFVS